VSLLYLVGIVDELALLLNISFFVLYYRILVHIIAKIHLWCTKLIVYIVTHIFFVFVQQLNKLRSAEFAHVKSVLISLNIWCMIR
jgi:hypothetical protein